MGAVAATRRAFGSLVASACAFVINIILDAVGAPQALLDLRISEYKGLSQALQVVDSRVLGEASSPPGLVTVVDSPNRSDSRSNSAVSNAVAIVE